MGEVIKETLKFQQWKCDKTKYLLSKLKIKEGKMEKDLIIRQTYDFYDGIVGQDILMDNEEVFSAYNLNECPEDAIISRDLFNAWDFIKAIELGMKLAKEGYVELNIITVENED